MSNPPSLPTAELQALLVEQLAPCIDVSGERVAQIQSEVPPADRASAKELFALAHERQAFAMVLTHVLEDVSLANQALIEAVLKPRSYVAPKLLGEVAPTP